MTAARRPGTPAACWHPAAAPAPASPAWSAQWPPAGAEPVAVDALYTGLSDIGYDYGPVFQGLQAVWRDGDQVYAEVALPAESADAAAAYGIHPALFDAALQSGTILAGVGIGAGANSQRRMPFSWSDARIERQGASRLRVRAVLTGDSVRLDAVDESGAEVVSVAAITFRPVDQAQLEGGRRSARNSLFTVDWTPVQARHRVGPGRACSTGSTWTRSSWPSRDGAELPEVVVADDRDRGNARRRWPSGRWACCNGGWPVSRWPRPGWSCVTRGGIAVGAEAPDLAVSPVWGLVRSAQSEHPGRFLLVDMIQLSIRLDSEVGVDWASLAALDEPQLAVRDGRLLAPRLVRAGAGELQPLRIDPAGTVLVTGGTSGLGAIFAAHLVRAHGARRLLLVSRRGAAADGVPALVAELEGLGAQVRVAACDVTDRAQLAALIGALDHPLTAVVHAAGVLDDGLLDSLTPQRLATVLRPKLDAAVHLDELTAGMELSAFVLFSSVAALIGSAGQANYAAANAALDALAARRRAAGLPATALAWGLWSGSTGMTGELTETELARLERLGIEALPAELGLELFDESQQRGDALQVPVALDLGGVADAGPGRAAAGVAARAGPDARPPGRRGRVAGAAAGRRRRRRA